MTRSKQTIMKEMFKNIMSQVAYKVVGKTALLSSL